MNETKEFDWAYIANSFGNLCGLPVRIYEKRKQTFLSPSFRMAKDPILLCEDDILSSSLPMGYFMDEDFFFYAYIAMQGKSFVVGPGRSIPADDKLIAKMAFKLDIAKEEEPAFRQFMRTLIPMPLESLLEALSMVYYVLSGEKINSRDILLSEAKEEKKRKAEKELLEQKIDELSSPALNNSLNVEQALCSLIEKGEVEALKEWMKVAPPTRPGRMSREAGRQLRYTFIASATTESRAAIRGHMDIQEALSLSDLYIQKMELLSTESEIYALMAEMALHYAEEVAKINGKGKASPFLREINAYLNEHLSSSVKAQDVCAALYLSRSVLFDKVKKETGLSFHDYVLSFKLDEAKRLLRETEKSANAIALYLGFSSPSHFNRVFKEKTGILPLEYRRKQ